jgi:hypothetical protein
MVVVSREIDSARILFGNQMRTIGLRTVSESAPDEKEAAITMYTLFPQTGSFFRQDGL